jgi:NAD(P)H-flavin reductase
MAVPKRAFQVTVEAIERLTPTVKVFRLGFTADAGFEFVAGQYVMVDIPRDAGILQKAYSIASPPVQRGSIDLCIKLVEGGYASTYFHRAVEIGTTLTIHEAQGTFVDRGVDRERLYVATGTGIAPIRSLIQALYATGFDGPLWLFFGVRYEDEILYETEWRRLAAGHPRFRFLQTVSRPRAWTGDVGWVQDLLRRYLTNPADKEAYVCGVVPMVKAVKPLLIELGVPRPQIHTEKYT